MVRFYLAILAGAAALAVLTSSGARPDRRPASPPPQESGIFPGERARDVSTCPHPPGGCPECSITKEPHK